MADWRIVTPTRAPRDDELLSVGLVLTSPGNLSIMYSQNKLGVTYQNVQPVVRYFYDFTANEWQDTSYTPIDITTVDLTIPEAAVSSATNKSPYFNLIAFEEGTTACKLAVTNEAKTLIRNALINKGVSVPDATPFRQYAGKVADIQSGGQGGGLDTQDCTLYVHNLHMEAASLYYNDGESISLPTTQFETIEHVNLAHDIYAEDDRFASQLPLTFSYDNSNGYFRIIIYPV